MLRTAVAVLFAFVLCAAPSRADDDFLSGYEAMKINYEESKALRDDEQSMLPWCNKLKYQDNNCLGNLMSLSAAYIYAKDYKAARKWLSYFKKYSILEYGELPCAVGGVTWPNRKAGTGWEYSSLLYYLDKLENKANAKKSGLRAYLCQGRSTLDFSISEETLNNDNFNVFMSNYYGAGEEYNGAKHNIAIGNVVRETYKKIRNAGGSDDSDNKKFELATKQVELYKNAGKQCRKMKFAKEICSFWDSWVEHSSFAVKRLMREGDIE